MTRSTRIVGLTALASSFLLLTACPPAKVARPLPNSTPTIPGSTANVSAPKLDVPPKPKMLGPIRPAIVLLPANLAEPEVRVRIGGELAEAPTAAEMRAYKAKYRGRVEAVKLTSGRYVIINYVPMEAYICGVLPKELLAGWSPATFRAQAIAARSYALFQLATGDSKFRAWDLSDDESSQVYGGIPAETAIARNAVNDTRGKILLADFRGQKGLFCTFFSSCSGIASQDPDDAWGDASVGPLSARKLGDVDALSKNFNWSGLVIPKADITRCVQSWGRKNENPDLANLGAVTAVSVGKRNAQSGRPTEFLLTDAKNKTAVMRAEEFRLAFIYDPLAKAPKPLSSHFDIQDSGSSITLVNGHGFGHGIGMSQWGAEALARRGKAYTDILAFYYPGSILTQAW